MTDKIPGYTSYVRRQVESSYDLNHKPVQDFLTAMQLVCKGLNKPYMIKASELAQKLDAAASGSPEITTYPDEWILHDLNVADLIQLLETELKEAGVKCFVLQKDLYVTPEVARDKEVLFYNGDKFSDLNLYRRSYPYKLKLH
jgi:hypothetical protein